MIPNEPALELVSATAAGISPASRCAWCLVPKSLGLNGKVSTLAQMLPQARYEHILINDSDIVAPPDYLRRVMRGLPTSDVGMVTSLYRGLAGKTLPSRMEALGLSTDFMGGVLVAREMEGGVRFALGATIATTKSVLREIGGLEALVDYLGDDYELGARTAAAGYKVELADVVVETALPDYTWREFWAHQMRWARNVKDRRAAQYFGLIVTFGWPGEFSRARCATGVVDVGGACHCCGVSRRRSGGDWARRARRSVRAARFVAGSAARFCRAGGVAGELRRQRSRVARDEVPGARREAGAVVAKSRASIPPASLALAIVSLFLSLHRVEAAAV